MDAISSISSSSFSELESTKVSKQINIDGSNSPESDFAKAVHSEPSEKAQAAIKFETMVISQFIGEMFKEQAAGAFGEGAEGDFYTSVFSDAISIQLSEAGGFGIAKLI